MATHVYTYCYKEVDGPLVFAPHKRTWPTPREAAEEAGKAMLTLFVEGERCPYFRLVRVAVED